MAGDVDMDPAFINQLPHPNLLEEEIESGNSLLKAITFALY